MIYLPLFVIVYYQHALTLSDVGHKVHSLSPMTSREHKHQNSDSLAETPLPHHHHNGTDKAMRTRTNKEVLKVFEKVTLDIEKFGVPTDDNYVRGWGTLNLNSTEPLLMQSAHKMSGMASKEETAALSKGWLDTPDHKAGSLIVADKLFTSPDFMDAMIFETFFRHSFENEFKAVSVEFGAHNGMYASNTWFFTHFLEWKSVLIEVSPSCFGLIQEWKDNAHYHKYGDDRLQVFHGGVCSEHTVFANFSENPASFKCPTSSERFNDWRGRDIPCHPLSHYLAESRHPQIDYLSMDCEGCEFEVLQTIDWEALNVGVAVIECVYWSEENKRSAMAMMKSRGYLSVFVDAKQHDIVFYAPSYFQQKYDEEDIQLTGVKDYLQE